jgi:hypothetical protein
MPMVFFGEPWDSPALNGILRVDTPIGQPCNACREPIIRGDRGFIELLTMMDNDPRTGEVTHIHAECRLEQIAGHLIGVCACQAMPAGYARARQIWNHFYDADGSSLWPQTATR